MRRTREGQRVNTPSSPSNKPNHEAPRHSSSLYPGHPEGSRVLLRVSGSDFSVIDRFLVAGSSLVIVGSVVWVPFALRWAWKRYRAIPKKDKKRKRLYAVFSISLLALMIVGPHRTAKFGDEWLKFRSWKLWRAWMRFVAMEVIADQPTFASALPRAAVDARTDDALLAFCPHGIFPFAFAFGVLPELAQTAFGKFRPVVATAVRLFPLLWDLISWLNPVDASRASVQNALSTPSSLSPSQTNSNGTNVARRIGLVPGGIAEIFEGYPKPSTHPDEEYAIVRKGFLKMACTHGIPVIPVYCFGATKMMRRLPLPGRLDEILSNILRVSLCIFYGVWGLPIPFRQRLLYVMGKPIHPPSASITSSKNLESLSLDAQVDDMHQQFCEELVRLFDRHKEAYGWGHKVIKLISK